MEPQARTGALPAGDHGRQHLGLRRLEKAEQLAQRGVAWPPPKGWRRDLEEKHRLGLRVVPLAYGRALRADRRMAKGTIEQAERRPEQAVSAPQVWVNDIGEVDPSDPPPWM